MLLESVECKIVTGPWLRRRRLAWGLCLCAAACSATCALQAAAATVGPKTAQATPDFGVDPRSPAESSPLTVPAAQPPASQPAPEETRAVPPLLKVEIARRDKPDAERKKMLGREFGNELSYEFRDQPPEVILRQLLHVAGVRIETNLLSPDVSYDYQIDYTAPRGLDIDPRRAAVDFFCKSAGLELLEITAEREVWVVRAGKSLNPVRRTSGGSGFDPAGEKALYNNSPIDGFFSGVEEKFGVLLEDRTGLTDRYDLWYPQNVDFAKARSQMSEAFGFSFEKQKREVRLYRLQAMATAQEAPKSVPTSQATSAPKAGGGS